VRVLSVDGGGYLGLATAAFVASTETHFGVTFHNSFDLFCGTSTGAIIALALASGKTGAEIVSLYRELGNTVFRAREHLPLHARLWPGMFRAKYDLHPLKRALDDAFGMQMLGDLLASGKMALITAYCVSTGHPRIFKTDHSAQLSLHNRYRLADIALASAAAPTYFPLVPLRNPVSGVDEVFCDGGVAANHPALLGYAEAVYELHQAPETIQVLSISTPRSDLAERSVLGLDRGILAWRILPAILIESPSQISHQLMKRLVVGTHAGPLYERIELANPDKLQFDRASAAATEQLILLGSTTAATQPVRQSLSPFFSKGGSALLAGA